MLTWITTLWANPVTRKYIFYAAAGLMICSFIGYKIYDYGTGVWEQSQKQQYLKGQKEAEKAFEKREAGLLQEVAVEKLKNQKGQAAYENNLKLLAAREDELLRARHALDLAAARIGAKAEASIQAGRIAAQNLDARDAADTITKFANELAADKDWRNRIPASPPHP